MQLGGAFDIRAAYPKRHPFHQHNYYHLHAVPFGDIYGPAQLHAHVYQHAHLDAFAHFATGRLFTPTG